MNFKYFFFCVCPILFLTLADKAQVMPYHYPSTIKVSAYYKVLAGNEPLFVYDNPVASFVAFDVKGEAHLTIKTNVDLKWVDIRPRNLHIQYSFADSTIKILVPGPSDFSIELNGKQDQPLFVFANAIDKAKPLSVDKNLVYFAAGHEYAPGEINLKSNQQLYIEGGAVVHGWVVAHNVENILIAGNGILDGSHNQDNNQYHRGIDLQSSKNVTLNGIILSNGTTWEVVPENCDKVTISNIKIVSHGNSDDGIDVVSSRNVLIDNCFIRTKDDCIAIKANSPLTKNGIVDQVMVKNCTIWNGPWGNGLEIGFELDASEVKNVTFKNCDIIHVEKGAAMSIHNAGKANVHHIIYDNIRIEDARTKLFDFAIFCSQYSIDGPKTEAERKANYLNGAWDGVTNVPPCQIVAHAPYRGLIHDVLIKNIAITEGVFPFSIFYGYDAAHYVGNVTLNNLTVYGKKTTDLKAARFFSGNTRGIKFE